MALKKQTASLMTCIKFVSALQFRTYHKAITTLKGIGTQPATMELDPAIFYNFKNLKEPTYLDLTIEQVLHFGEIKNMVVGVSNVQPQQTPKVA